MSENDLTQFQEKGITAFAAEQQLYFFRNGFPYPDIVSPATAERGISIFDENQIQELINEFDSFKVKFQNLYRHQEQQQECFGACMTC